MKIPPGTKSISFPEPGQQTDTQAFEFGTLCMTDWLRASSGKGAGGSKSAEEGQKEKKERDKQIDETPQGIADPDSPLTGDTGNTDLGQTDLGASGTGLEDPTANKEE
jgi:hypothetical protein